MLLIGRPPPLGVDNPWKLLVVGNGPGIGKTYPTFSVPPVWGSKIVVGDSVALLVPCTYHASTPWGFQAALSSESLKVSALVPNGASGV